MKQIRKQMARRRLLRAVSAVAAPALFGAAIGAAIFAFAELSRADASQASPADCYAGACTQ